MKKVGTVFRFICWRLLWGFFLVVKVKTNLVKMDVETLKKAMREVVQEELKEVKEELHIVKEELKDVKGELNIVKEDLKDVKGELNIVKEDLKDVKGELNIVKEELKDVKGELNIVKEDLKDVKGELKDLKTTIGRLDIRTAFLFELTARAALREEYGSTFVKEFTAEDVYALLKISLPKETYKKEGGFVDLVRDGDDLIKVHHFVEIFD